MKITRQPMFSSGLWPFLAIAAALVGVSYLLHGLQLRSLDWATLPATIWSEAGPLVLSVAGVLAVAVAVTLWDVFVKGGGKPR